MILTYNSKLSVSVGTRTFFSIHLETDVNIGILSNKESLKDKYIAIYFGHFKEYFGQLELDRKSSAVSAFLYHLHASLEMKKQGHLNDDMFNRLVNSYLNDVSLLL